MFRVQGAVGRYSMKGLAVMALSAGLMAPPAGAAKQPVKQVPKQAVNKVPEGPLADDMVQVPAGPFLSGPDKKEVQLEAFSIDRTEVTQEAYRRCVEAEVCVRPVTDGYCNWEVKGRDKHPVNCVNWHDAETYCKWAGGKRLPTEQEWEKAARGADGRLYPWGDQPPACNLAVMTDESGDGCGQKRTWPVCSKPEGNSPYGLCDMSGNVWEWTADWYDDQKQARALRGGSWFNGAAAQTVNSRNQSLPVVRPRLTPGFRCVR